jgi:hypothetical protein
MLLLKPCCECCDIDLPPDSRDAMICSFECTFFRQSTCPPLFAALRHKSQIPG